MPRVVVRVESEKLEPENLRGLVDLQGCGSVVSFVGLTRGVDDGVEGERLEFVAWEEKLPAVLNRVAFDAV